MAARRQQSDASARPSLLGTALYLTALALVVDGFAQAAATGTENVAVGSLRWRFGVLGVFFLTLATPVLGMAIGSLTAAYLGHRRMLGALVLIQLAFSLGLVIALAAFVLDATELLRNFPPASRTAFLLRLIKTGGMAAGAAGLLTVLALRSWKALRISSSRVSAPKPSGQGIVVAKGR